MSDLKTSSVAIQAESLRKTYTEGTLFRKKFEALKGITFQVNKGEAFGLLGPNGAGKTTFIKVLLGIIRKSGGNASLLGFPAGSRAGRQLVGYLPEHLRVPPHMTGYTALECFGNLANIPNSVIKEKRDKLLDVVGLGGRGRDRVAKYSKGMVQRLGLAQSLLNDPQLLILDEPTDGLDPAARAEVRKTIKNLTEQGVTIFLNSHLLAEVESTCDRVAILNCGELKYCGSVKDIGEFIGASREGEIRIRMRVVGPSETIAASFFGFDYKIAEEVSQRESVVNAVVPNQAAIDQLIDTLRKNSLSIASLERQQVSLEDAFLKIVNPMSGKN